MPYATSISYLKIFRVGIDKFHFAPMVHNLTWAEPDDFLTEQKEFRWNAFWACILRVIKNILSRRQTKDTGQQRGFVYPILPYIFFYLEMVATETT